MAIIVGIVLGICAPLQAAEQRDNVRLQRIYLLHADARDVARMFGLAARARPQRPPVAARRRPGIGPSGLVRPEAKPDLSRPSQLVAWAGFPDPREQYGGPDGTTGAFRPFAPPDLLPGEMKPPIPIPGHNALLVTGTPAEIDEFREILQLFDVPPTQVRIRADIVNVLTRIEKALGLDFTGTFGPVGGGTSGNVPPDANIAWRMAFADVAAVVGAMQRETRRSERAGAEVMTMTGQPGLIRVGQSVPYFLPQTTVTYGAVTTNYIPFSAFVGVELYVTPRVNADDTVSMGIRVSLIDETGTVLGPGGAVPTTKQTLTSALIRVPDGDSVCIAGLPRRQNSTTTSPLGTRQIIDDSELLVFVTPTILRPVNVPR